MFDPHDTSFDAPLHVPDLLTEVDAILDVPIDVPNEPCILVGNHTCVAVLHAEEVADFVKFFKPVHILPLSELTADTICALPDTIIRDALLIGYIAATRTHS